MIANISLISNAISTVHDCYVEAYSGIAFMTNALIDRIPYLPDCIRSCAGNIVYKTTEVVCGVSTKVIKCTNWLFGHSQNETCMRSYRLEMQQLISGAKAEVFKLSKACSIVFDKTVIFSSVPNYEQTQELLEKLYLFKENTAFFTPPKKLKAANQAIASCFKLNKVHQQIEKLKKEDISTEDFQAYAKSISRNVLLTTSIGAIIENLGEVGGGYVIDEEMALIPKVYNPAVILGTKVCNFIGKPIGKAIGTSIGLAGIYYLLEKLPLMQLSNRRKTIQAAAILFYLGAEYFQLNPLTNFLQNYCGQVGYDFAFYSVALLFNYIGMYMAGTGESLGSYVRNMTPSILVYNGVNTLFSLMGLEGISSGVIAFYLSHVAYNFEI